MTDHEELKQLAMLALKNAFHEDFSALVNAYLAVAKGLDAPMFEIQLSEAANVFSRNANYVDMAEGDYYPNIWTQNASGGSDTTGHYTILEALEFDRAIEITLQGRKVFKRRDGEWYFTGGEGETNG